MAALAGEVTLHKDLDSNFHRSAVDPIHGRLENHQIANPHRNQKIQVIGRGGHNVAARVAMGSKRASNVDPVHEPPTQQGAERIGVIRQNKFHHLGN